METLTSVKIQELIQSIENTEFTHNINLDHIKRVFLEVKDLWANEISDNDSQLEDLENTIADLKSELRYAKELSSEMISDETSTYRSEIYDLNSKISELENKISESDDIISSKDDEISELQSQLDDAHDSLSHKDDEIANLEDKISDLQDEMASMSVFDS